MLEFEWDPDKAVANANKHGITFEEAASVFGDPLSLTAYDPDHSQDEDRYITLGTSAEGRLLMISHTDRDAGGTNIVRLAPDVAEKFPDEKSVNDALRFVIQIAADAGRLTGRSI